MSSISPEGCATVARPRTRAGVFKYLHYILDVAAQRRALRRLDNHARADIGISKSQALTESNKPVWDVPRNWTQ